MQEENIQDNIKISRLRRKLDRKEQKIQGLVRRVQELEHQLAVKETSIRRLPVEIERAVQRALCNVRMIPILGIGSDDKILEITTKKSEE